MALILARKIRQYRSVVSILQQSSKIFPSGLRPLSKRYCQRVIKDDVLQHIFPTGPALLVSFVRHHKAAIENPSPPLCCLWWAPIACNIDIVKKSQFLFTPVCFALIAS